MGLSVETLAVAKKYTDGSISGISGTLAGKNCTIDSITDVEGGHRVTFKWTADNGTVRTQTMDVADGSGAEAIEQIYADNGVLGAKNLLENTASTQTVNGVTFTVNDDGSITANGQALANASITIATYLTLPTEIIGQNVILTGCPEGGSTDGKYFMNAIGFRSASSGDTDTGNGVQINNVYDFTANTATKIYIEVRSGYNAQNLTFYPMIRLASDTDSTYKPYAMTNKELTESKMTYADNGVLGAKNLLPNNATSQTINDVTFTVNDDGTVIANGQASANAPLVVWDDLLHLEEGSYIFTGCPAGGSAETYSMMVQDEPYTTTKFETGNGLVLDVPAGGKDYHFYYARIVSGYNAQNLVFKPMLRLASDTDSTYVPYAETNYQLTKNKVSWDEQAVLGAKNLLENTASNKSNGNVSWTVNADKSTKINTSAAASSVQTLHIGEVTGLQGDYILNGVTGGSISTFGIQLYDVTTSTWETQYALDGDSIINLADKNHTYRFVAFVREGVEVSNKTIYPMLRLASDPDDTYQPYAMTNRELTEVKVFDENSAGFSVSNATIHWAKSCMKKCGNMCMFTFMVTTTGAISQYDNIVKLPTEMRPQSFTRLQVQSTLNCVMDESGSIYAAEAIESGITAYLSGTYIM